MAAALAGLAVPRITAAINWNESSGGSFGDVANWDTAAPTSVDDAVFGLAETYTVAIDGDVFARNVGITAGTVTLDLAADKTLVVTAASNGAVSVGGGASLTIQGPGFISAPAISVASTGSLTIAADSTVNLNNGNGARPSSLINGTATVGGTIVGAGAAFRVGEGAGEIGALTFTSGGGITMTPSNTNASVGAGLYGGTGVINVVAGSGITIEDNNTASNYGSVSVGYGAGANGTLNQSGGTVYTGGAMNLGVDGATGVYNLSGGTLAQHAPGNAGTRGGRHLYIGNGTNGSGTLNITGTGAFTVNASSYVDVGSENGTGKILQNGADTVVTIGGAHLAFGSSALGTAGTGSYDLRAGTLNVNSGWFLFGMTGGTGHLLQSGGLLNAAVKTYIGYGGSGTFELSGGTASLAGGLHLANDGASTATVTLTGGTLEIGGTNGLSKGAGTASVNFGGSGATVATLKVSSNLTSSLGLNIAGNAVIDTAGHNATLSGNLAGTGTLTKAGTGTLILSGTNTLTGATSENYIVGGGIHQTGGTSTFRYFAIGSGAGNSGEYLIDGGTLAVTQTFQVGDFSGTGSLTIDGGAVTVSAASGTSLNIGNQGGTGTLNLESGSLTLGRGLHNLGRMDNRPLDLAAGRGTLNLRGGLLEIIDGGSLINGDRISGNTNTTPKQIFGSGEINHEGGTLRVTNGTLYVAGHGSGTYNLKTGGVLEVGGSGLLARYNSTTSTSVFNFAGGTIKVLGSALDTDVRPILAAGTTSTINTNGLGATFTRGLEGDGGFAKTGAGALNLLGTSTLKGDSTASALLQVASGTGKTGTLTVESDLTVTVTDAVSRLQVGVNGGTGTVNLRSGASFTIDDSAAQASRYGTLDVGRGTGSTGTFNQTGGSVAVSAGALQVGYSGGTGTYTLSGTAGYTQAGAGSSFMLASGTNARGTLTIGGDSTFSTNAQTFVGAGTGAIGTITQSGEGSTATFTGPAVWFGTDSDETLNTPGRGVYNLQAGALNFTGMIQGVRFGTHASGGSGVFNQSGGTATFTDTTLSIGATGDYNLSAGTAKFVNSSLTVASGGTFDFTGGTLEIGGSHLSGAGVFTFAGGTVKVGGSALATAVRPVLAAGTTSVIDTTAYGATFSTGLAGDGGFSQTGANALNLLGTTVLKAASDVDGLLQVGAGSGKTGVLTLQTALVVNVTDTVSRLQVGVAGGNGTVNLGPGASFKLESSAAQTGQYGTFDVGRGLGSVGVFNQTGGSVTTEGSFLLGYDNGQGTYRLSGGTFNGPADGHHAYLGQGAAASGELIISDTGAFAAGDGAYLDIGINGGQGTITQTGGSASFNGDGVAFGSAGEGGSAGQGTYTLQGGTATVTEGTFVFGHTAGGSGALNQSAGTLTSAVSVVIGQAGEGSYTLTGGTARLNGGLSLAQQAGSAATVDLDGGVLEVGGVDGIAKGAGTAALSLNGGTIRAVGSTLTSAVGATLGGTTSFIDTNGLAATFSGAFTGTGGLSKIGAGVLTLSGTNNFTGATQVTTGTLKVDGSLTGSTAYVADGATLRGKGSVKNASIASGGSIILAGDGDRLAVTGDLTLGAGSFTRLEISDFLDFIPYEVGTLTAGGQLTIDFALQDFDLLTGGETFTIFDAGNYAGDFSLVLLPSLAGYNLAWDADNLARDGTLSILAIPIPEPSTWAAVCGALALVLAIWLRRAGRSA